MNVFSSDKYLEILKETFYSGKKCSVEYIEASKKKYKVLVVDGHKVVAEAPFMDFLEPSYEEVSATRKVSYLPAICHETVAASQWNAANYPGNFEPSPYIDWSEWDDWEAFIARCQGINKRAFGKRMGKSIEKLEKDIGPVKLIFSAEPELGKELLETLLNWKASQYINSGFMNVFAKQQNRELFYNFFKHDFLTISALISNDIPLAIHAGFEWNGRFYYLLPAYDPKYRKYSTGTIMTEYLIKKSFENRNKEFDFLLGDEEYKYTYTNKVRVVGPLGTRLLQDKIWQPMRTALMGPVRRFPGVYKFLQETKKKIREKV